MQTNLDLIPHETAGAIVYQRPADGYINATAMCQAAGKQWGHYRAATATSAFLAELSADIGIPISEIVQSIKGGDPRLQGTWVHPDVAVNLAQWLSPRFAVQVSRWVRDWMSGRARPADAGRVPYHLRRHFANYVNVPQGHFSILVEMTTLMIAPLEIMGYSLPERMLPDISMGRIFCGWLRKQGIDTDALPTYWHHFEDGRRVQAKAYPESLLASFRRHYREEWLPNRAEPYFRERDAVALQYLPKLLPAPLKQVG